jgi:type I restriction enzyme S subunit
LGNSNFGKTYFLSCAKKSTNLASINSTQLKEFPVVIPPLPEQEKIAEILSTWDKAINTALQLLDKSRLQRKGLMQKLLSGKKRLPSFEDDWMKTKIGAVLKEVKRPVIWDDSSNYNLLSVKRRSEGIILRETLKGFQIKTKKMNHVITGDFIISKMQVVHGATGLVQEKFDGFHISDSYITLVAKEPQAIDTSFFDWVSKQPIMYHKSKLCSYGVHIEKMTFNLNLYLKEEICIPSSIKEQQKIAKILSTADKEIELLQQKVDALKQEKKALMQQLLTGKRRVKV